MLAREIMTSDPVCCSLNDTVQQAAKLMVDHDCGCIPVVDDQDGRCVMGVITDRDIAVRAVSRGRPADTRVREVMTNCLCCCGADTDVHEIEDIMSEAQVRRVLVLDDAGTCLGIVAQADLARAAERSPDVTEQELGRVLERISEPTSGLH